MGHAQDIVSAEIVSSSADTRIVLTFDDVAPEPDKFFRIANDNPRIVMDWNSASYIMKHRQNTIKGQGGVRSIRYAKREDGTRIVIDIVDAKTKVTRQSQGKRLMIILNGAGAAAGVPAPVKAKMTEPAPRVSRVYKPRYFGKKATPYPILKPARIATPTQQKPMHRPVIVIDPGHGGYDPGALGKKGTKEKNITFAASKELQRQLLATGRYDVIITRSKDVYVDHEERLRIARAGGADLFISIHADSAGPKARGATVYTLADRAKTRSRRLVNSQNWIMDVDLAEQTDPVGDILVDLAQRSTKTASTQFADILLGRLKGSTRLINNSHRRAGYFVLLAPDVPAVLLELGYLSNPADEKLLNKPAHRKKVIRSVTSAINSYFDTQRP